MCPVCFKVQPAIKTDNGQSVVITTYCQEHGPSTGVREISSQFYRWIKSIYNPAYQRLGTTCVNVTNSCNTKCPNCYHRPDGSGDIPEKEILANVRKANNLNIIFLGAEPTAHSDLFGLIARTKAATGRYVGIYTNGLKLADRAYADELKRCGVDFLIMSHHHPKYIGPKNFEAKSAALQNIKDAGLKLNHVSFSIDRLEDVGLALDCALNADLPKGVYARLRVAGEMGKDKGSTIHVSQLADQFHKELVDRKLTAKILPTSHSYSLMTEVDGREFYLLRWPSVTEMDFDDLHCCPARGLLVPELGETPLVYQAHNFARMRC